MNENHPPLRKWSVLGLGTAVSIALGIAWIITRPRTHEVLPPQPNLTAATALPSAIDHLQHIVAHIGERHGACEPAANALKQMATMIQTRLPASYAVESIAGPADWPLIHASLTSSSASAATIWIATTYDSHPTSLGVEANATGVAATLAAAIHLANHAPRANLHFVFLPHLNDPESPILENVTQLRDLITQHPQPNAILCIEAMGANESLWVSSRDPQATPLRLIGELGSVRGAEVVCLGEDTDLASLLFQMDLPAVRVATRPIVTASEPDLTLPAAATLAASSGRLVAFIHRCAGNP